MSHHEDYNTLSLSKINEYAAMGFAHICNVQDCHNQVLIDVGLSKARVPNIYVEKAVFDNDIYGQIRRDKLDLDNNFVKELVNQTLWDKKPILFDERYMMELNQNIIINGGGCIPTQLVPDLTVGFSFGPGFHYKVRNPTWTSFINGPYKTVYPFMVTNGGFNKLIYVGKGCVTIYTLMDTGEAKKIIEILSEHPSLSQCPNKWNHSSFFIHKRNNWRRHCVKSNEYFCIRGGVYHQIVCHGVFYDMLIS